MENLIITHLKTNAQNLEMWIANDQTNNLAVKDYTIYAWCKDSSLPLLIEKGFETGEIVTYVEKKI